MFRNNLFIKLLNVKIKENHKVGSKKSLFNIEFKLADYIINILNNENIIPLRKKVYFYIFFNTKGITSKIKKRENKTFLFFCYKLLN